MAHKTRNYRTENYRPLLKKSVRNVLIKKLRFQYGFNNNKKLAEILIDDILEQISKFTVPTSNLKSGQMLWMAVAEDDFSYHKSMDQHRLIPVVLTVITEDEIKRLREGVNPTVIRQERVIRMFHEAKQQKGVLGHNDIALILGYARSIITADVRNYQKETNLMLPSRGWIHDLGPTTTHKASIIELHLKGYLTQDISRMTCHTPQSVDRYIRDFEKVKLLYGKFNTDQIAAITGMLTNLISQYELLIEKYLAVKLPDTKKINAI